MEGDPVTAGSPGGTAQSPICRVIDALLRQQAPLIQDEQEGEARQHDDHRECDRHHDRLQCPGRAPQPPRR